jgi:hypothetical protein
MSGMVDIRPLDSFEGHELNLPEADRLSADLQSPHNLMLRNPEMQKDGKKDDLLKIKMAAREKCSGQGGKELPASAAADPLPFPKSPQGYARQRGSTFRAVILSFTMDRGQYPSAANFLIQIVGSESPGDIGRSENMLPRSLVISCLNFHGFHFSTLLFSPK